MPKFKSAKKSGGFVMNMGFNSKDSDTTFKEKDQANITAGPGKYSKYPLDNAIISGAVKVFKGFGKIRGSGGTSSVPKAAAPVTKAKKADMGAAKQSFLSSVGPTKPKASTPAPKKQTKTVKPAVKSIATPKAASVSIAAPKPTASTSIPTQKPKAAASTPKTKSSKIRKKGEIALASGNVKKAKRLRKRYDRIKKRENKKAGIADAYKVNL